MTSTSTSRADLRMPPFILSLVVDNQTVYQQETSAAPSVGSTFFANLPDGNPVYAEVDQVGWTLSADRREVHAAGHRIEGDHTPPQALLDEASAAGPAPGAGSSAGPTVLVLIRTDDDVVFFKGNLGAVPRHGDYVLGYLDHDPSGILVKITHSVWYMAKGQGNVVDLMGTRLKANGDTSRLFGL
jgi:hypothetical protein